MCKSRVRARVTLKHLSSTRSCACVRVYVGLVILKAAPRPPRQAITSQLQARWTWCWSPRVRRLHSCSPAPPGPRGGQSWTHRTSPPLDRTSGLPSKAAVICARAASPPSNPAPLMCGGRASQLQVRYDVDVWEMCAVHVHGPFPLLKAGAGISQDSTNYLSALEGLSAHGQPHARDLSANKTVSSIYATRGTDAGPWAMPVPHRFPHRWAPHAVMIILMATS